MGNRRTLIFAALTLILVVIGAYSIPAYKAYYKASELELQHQSAIAEAKRIRIIGQALDENERYIDWKAIN